MDRQELDAKVEDMAKTLLSYCSARTSNHFEAEDLAQDIILEIYKSADNIRNIDAVYGFMWAVAGNVYKQWCKNKAKDKECELTDHLPDVAELLDADDSSLQLLRRELTLLSEKYRKAVVLYYIENKSCSEISDCLSISENMVKYLLFKSRQILKEGMSMERNYGKQSYHPKELSLLFWGNGANRYYHLCDSRISQNILFACYNDKLSAEQISLEIGVSLPYMEDKLAELCEYEFLKKDGNRYYTNIVIFTKDFASEVNVKTADLRKNIADMLIAAISEQEKAVRNIGFYGAEMNHNAFSWQMVSFILYRAVVENLQNKIEIVYPKDKFGTECFIWGSENDAQNSWRSEFGFGISNVVNSNGDYVQFMDFPINGEMVHHYCFNRQNVTNVFLDIAKGHTAHFSDNDKALAADMVRKGYVISNDKGLFVNAPVFTEAQYQALKNIFAETVEKIADEAETLMETVTKILKNHMPGHLKKFAKDMAYFRLFEDAISAPVAILYDRKYLLPYDKKDILPTTYVILK
ncbi:MAG: RNA polymerase sigma factor [Clostridia bacterium]|nr:RNA polymerase sigma factor [Clostridia bacterium]